MKTSTVDVLVVGAGPVGLTAAAAFLKQGVSCRIIEKTPVPSDKSKALVVWSRTLELLSNLGLAETFVSTGLKLKAGAMYAGGKTLVRLTLRGTDSAFDFPLMIPQNDTERLLMEYLAGHGLQVERSAELIGFVQKAETVECQVRQSDGTMETITTSWLIGCDGAHSAVRHGLGMEFTGHADLSNWMLADVNIAGTIPPDEVSIFWKEDGVLALFPIRGSRFRIISSHGGPQPSAPADPTLADVQAELDANGPGGLTVSNPIWLTNFRINERKVADYRSGRVLLAGDAAHIHSPAGGQGMNTGMQDAFNLAWKVALVQRGQGQLEPLLTSYSIERSAVGDQVLKNAEQFTTLATLRSPIARSLRNHLAPIIGSFRPVQHSVRDQWFEHSINYRHSPLSAQHWPLLTGGQHAGDRLCNLPIKATGKEEGSLSSLGYGFTLLVLPGSNAADRSNLLALARDIESVYPSVLTTRVIFSIGSAHLDDSGWVDSTGELYDKLAAHKPTILVVRPDGYIGYRGQPADGAALRQYLATFLVAA